MEDKKYTAKVELSRREEEVVKGFMENWLAWDALNKNDAREEIYEELVKHRYGEYSMRGERATREPPWNAVFKENLCPSCNSDEDILKGGVVHRLEEDGENLACKNCSFKIKKTLWEDGKKANEKEKEIIEKDVEFTKKIRQYKIPREHLEELAKKGIAEAQRIAEMTTQEEDQNTPPEEQV